MKTFAAVQIRLAFIFLSCAGFCLTPRIAHAETLPDATASTDAVRYGGRESDVQAPQPDPSKADQIPAYVVQEPIFKAYLSPEESQTRDLFRGMTIGFGPFAFGINFGSPYLSTPAKAYQPSSETPVSAAVVKGTAESDSNSIWPDDGLSSGIPPWLAAGDPNSILAPPLANSSPALRGVGGGGQETKLLVDGIPANDPFTGAFLPAVGISRIEEIADGGAVAWGDGDLGGAVQLFTSPDIGRLATRPGALAAGGAPDSSLPKQIVVGTGEFLVGIGGLNTRDVEAMAVEPTPVGMLQLLGRDFSSDGSPLVANGRSGPIDLAAYNRNDFLEARWSQLLSKKVILTAEVSGFDQSDGAGTPYQVHHAEGEFASVELDGRPSRDLLWTAVAYARVSYGSARFSSVDANRDGETPVLDETATPTTEIGASWSGQWRSADGSRTSAGLDATEIRGESRLLTGYTQGGFTRELAGGGEQGGGGVFMERDQKLGNSLHVTIGGRISHWAESDGHNRMTELTTDEALNADHVAANQGTEFSPQLGAAWTPNVSWLLHANAQQTFSRPTLNDLYNPSGQYSMLTENDPTLRTEHNTSFEFGTEYSFYSSKELENHKSGFTALQRPKPFLTLGATAFENQMRNALGFRSLTSDPILFVSGAIPSGYIVEQRINLDRSRSDGLDLVAKWQIAAALSLRAETVFDDPTIGKSSAEAVLTGRQLAGIPRQTSSATLSWGPQARIHLSGRLRYTGREYEDDENILRLGATLTEDVGAVFTIVKNVDLSASLQNLGNHRVDLGRSPEGFFYEGSPRILLIALRLKW